MVTAAIAVVILAQMAPAPAAPAPGAGAPAAGPGAPAAGATAARVDCAAGRERTTVWDRARAPQVMRYCDFLAHAEARLPREPRRAEQAAEAAGNLMPGQAAPRVVRARAALALGQPAQARALLEEAQALDGEAIGRDARAQLALAVSLRETGAAGPSVEAYRALVPRLDALPEDERGRARIDAALALTLGATPATGEAQALLREGAEQGPVGLRSVARAALALVLDRAGSRDEASAQASEALHAGALAALGGASGSGATGAASKPAAVSGAAGGSKDGGITGAAERAASLLDRPAGAAPDRGPIGWQAEAVAVAARLREASEPVAAAGLWEAYAARSGQGPWAAHARKRADELRRGGGRPAPRKGAR